MNSYPTELRTPPLPLVAFVGVTDVQKEIGTYFSQVLRPPLVSVGVAEASGTLLARLFGGWVGDDSCKQACRVSVAVPCA